MAPLAWLPRRPVAELSHLVGVLCRLTIEDVDALAREPHAVVISVHAKLNLDYLLEKMWDYMGLVRIFTKKRGCPPDFAEPVILSSNRHGLAAQTRRFPRQLASSSLRETGLLVALFSTRARGLTQVEAFTSRISKDLLAIFGYAHVWGTSAKHSHAHAATPSER